MTFRSVGEIVTMRIESEGKEVCVLELFSKPWLGTTQVDYGKNFENVELICEFVGQKYAVERIAANQ